MPWVMFAFAIGAVVVTFKTNSVGIAALSLLLALVLAVAATLMLASARISGRARDASSMLGPEELEAIKRRAKAGGAGLAVGGAAAAGDENGIRPAVEVNLGEAGDGGGDGGGD